MGAADVGAQRGRAATAVKAPAVEVRHGSQRGQAADGGLAAHVTISRRLHQGHLRGRLAPLVPVLWGAVAGHHGGVFLGRVLGVGGGHVGVGLRGG